jgi:hypothetical protein
MASNVRDWVGLKIGRYRIQEKLGEGGMASVYKAFDTTLEREVAFKVILPGQEQSATFLKRFEREAKALARLSHPNIVDVIDYGTHNGVPYLVMVYAPGGSLHDWMAVPLPWAKAARILAPIARALAYAHQENIIHRDVKPSNILISKSGDPLLSDFGIAKLLEEHVSGELTTSGVGIGTVEYMAPEQVQGKTVDGRSDVYSLGVVFYELITGHRPYEASAPGSVIWKLATEDMVSPRRLTPDLPEEVENAILKALGRTPQERFPDMHTFAGILEDLAAQGRQRGVKDAPLFDLEEMSGHPATAPGGEHPSLWQRTSQRLSATIMPLSRGRRFFLAVSLALLAGLVVLALGRVLFAAAPQPTPTPVITQPPAALAIATPTLTLIPSATPPSPTPTLTPLPTSITAVQVFTDYQFLGVSFPSGEMMVSIQVPGIHGEFRAEANGFDYRCSVLPEFPDRLYCMGPTFWAGTEVTLKVFPLQGNSEVLEVQFAVPQVPTPNPSQAACFSWCAFSDSPQDSLDQVDCAYPSYDAALGAARNNCLGITGQCVPSAYCNVVNTPVSTP